MLSPSKIHPITERTGLPLSVGISGANVHDSQALIPLVKGIPPIRSRRGPRRRKPGKLYRHLRQWLSKRGIRHRLARKGVDTSQRLGRHRWTMERIMAWLTGCRRLHRRYERKADHFLAFTSLACKFIAAQALENGHERLEARAGDHVGGVLTGLEEDGHDDPRDLGGAVPVEAECPPDVLHVLHLRALGVRETHGLNAPARR